MAIGLEGFDPKVAGLQCYPCWASP